MNLNKMCSVVMVFGFVFSSAPAAFAGNPCDVIYNQVSNSQNELQDTEQTLNKWTKVIALMPDSLGKDAKDAIIELDTSLLMKQKTAAGQYNNLRRLMDHMGCNSAK